MNLDLHTLIQQTSHLLCKTDIGSDQSFEGKCILKFLDKITAKVRVQSTRMFHNIIQMPVNVQNSA